MHWKEKGEEKAMSTAMDTPMAHSGITTATNAAGQGIRWFRRLVLMNLGLVALQALSAGFFMSGYGRAVAIHAGIAPALQLGALTQAVAAVVLWRRGCVPAWVARAGIGLFLIVVLRSAPATPSGTGCTCQLASASSAG
jgi:hypothetical protein